MQQLTHTPTENPSTNIHENQQNIHDIRNIWLGGCGKWNIHMGMTPSAHSEVLPSSAHDNQPKLLYNNIKCLSKTTFLKFSKHYRLVSTFVRLLHQALTVRLCHRALTMIKLYHYIHTLDDSWHQSLKVRPAFKRSWWSI